MRLTDMQTAVLQTGGSIGHVYTDRGYTTAIPAMNRRSACGKNWVEGTIIVNMGNESWRQKINMIIMN